MACANSGKSSCADACVAGRGVLLVGFLGAALSELLDDALDEALDEGFTDVPADESLSLPFCFLFFGLLFFFFCTFEVGGLAAAAGRFGVFAFLYLPPAVFIGDAEGATAGTLPVLEALERVVGAMLFFCWDKYGKVDSSWVAAEDAK